MRTSASNGMRCDAKWNAHVSINRRAHRRYIYILYNVESLVLITYVVVWWCVCERERESDKAYGYIWIGCGCGCGCVPTLDVRTNLLSD